MQPALEERQADGTARIRRAGQKARRGEGKRFDDELLFSGGEKKRIIVNGRFILRTGGLHAEQIIACIHRADRCLQADGLRLGIRNQNRIPQAGMGNRMQTDAAQHAGGAGCVKAEADGLPAPEVERTEQRNAEHAVLRILEGGGGRIADEHAPPAADQLKDQLGVLRMQLAEIQFEPQFCRAAHILRKGGGQGKRRIGRRGFQ